jgi:hypothetical protein
VGWLGYLKLHEQASIYEWRNAGKLYSQWSSRPEIVFGTASYYYDQQTASPAVHKTRNAPS